MSKKKKTIEDLAEEAIISEDDQLYEVPRNWVWSNLNSLSKVVVDGSHNPPPKQSEGFPMLSGRNILNGKINFDTDRYVSEENYLKEYKRTPIESNDVLLTIVGTIGRTTVVPKEFSPFVLQRSVALIKPMINSNYLSYYLSSPEFQIYLQRNAKGTAQKGVYLKTLKSSSVPLPPLNEQKRIAEKVERLIGKIEEAKQLIEEAKETFKLRRAATLDKAFRGELIKFDISLENLGSLVTLKSGKSLSQDDLSKNGSFSYIKVSDMNLIENQREIVTSNNFIVDNGKLSKGLFPKGTVIFPKRGGAIHTNKKRILSAPAMCDLNIMGIICPENINTYYMFYWMQSIDLRNLDNGSSVPQINNKDIEPLQFPLISMEKQNEVVKLLDSLTLKEEKLIEIIEWKLNELDVLKQSILSKAFRGELGTNDPSEEIAIELLKDVLQEKVK